MSRRRRIALCAVSGLVAAALIAVAFSVPGGVGQDDTGGDGAGSAGHGATVTLFLKAPGWTKGDGSFGFAIVGGSGRSAATGELTPGHVKKVALESGMYAISLTSIPTAKDAKTTWAVPQPVQFVLRGGGAKAKLILTQIDLTDEASLNSVLEALPEDQREATRQIVERKRSDPSSDGIGRAPSKPLVPPHGGSGGSSDSDKGGPGGRWGVVKGAWDETVTVRAAWDERVTVREAWDERVVDRPAWTETVHHPAEYRTERIKVGVYFCSKDGKTFDSENDAAMYYYNTGIPYYVMPKYENRQVLVRDAWDERVDHAATWRSVHHDAEYRTVHHPAETRVVHHPDEYGWIDS